MLPSTTTSIVVNQGQGMVESHQENTFVTTTTTSSSFHMGFFSHPSPLPPHLTFPPPPYALQSALQTLAPSRVGEFSPNLRDLGSSSSLQEPTSTNMPWPWGEEENASRPTSTKEDLNNNISHKNTNISRNYNSNTSVHSLPSVGAKKMKKVMKARRKLREPRFCFKTMSEVDVLDDGYKWRKYGQKVVKNTQHSRGYYRCTQCNCRVKKRVERLAEDARMVITTYEGRHAHSPPRDEDESNQASSHIINFFG